jgi:hypothetical protein
MRTAIFTKGQLPSSVESKVLSPNSLPLMHWNLPSLLLKFLFFLGHALVIRRVGVRVEYANGSVLINVCTPNCHRYRVWRDVPASTALSDLSKSSARNLHEGEEHDPKESEVRSVVAKILCTYSTAGANEATLTVANPAQRTEIV